MLRKEDCLPGVEVIAIKNNNNDVIEPHPPLVLGKIYTIKVYAESCLNISIGTIIKKPHIGLEELIDPSDGLAWAYGLHQFKLRRKEEMTKLFKTSDMDLEKFKEKEEELV